jgi:hypothetical protein
MPDGEIWNPFSSVRRARARQGRGGRCRAWGTRSVPWAEKVGLRSPARYGPSPRPSPRADAGRGGRAPTAGRGRGMLGHRLAGRLVPMRLPPRGVRRFSMLRGTGIGRRRKFQRQRSICKNAGIETIGIPRYSPSGRMCLRSSLTRKSTAPSTAQANTWLSSGSFDAPSTCSRPSTISATACREAI